LDSFSNRACSCPGSDHPGPDVSRGRGAPEIDIFEAEKDKANPTGQVVSQSAQFAPFTHDYIYLNATQNQWTIYDTAMTTPNTYHGSAVCVTFSSTCWSLLLIFLDPRQQAVSGLAKLPSDMFQGSPNKRLVKMGGFWVFYFFIFCFDVTWFIPDSFRILGEPFESGRRVHHVDGRRQAERSHGCGGCSS